MHAGESTHPDSRLEQVELGVDLVADDVALQLGVRDGGHVVTGIPDRREREAVREPILIHVQSIRSRDPAAVLLVLPLVQVVGELLLRRFPIPC